MATDTSRFSLTLRDLCSFDMYKRNQGRRIRTATTCVLLGLAAWGAWVLRAHLSLSMENQFAAVATVGGVVAVLCWTVYRLVWGWPRFSDFLIATEAEMAKVSWSKWEELKQATVVVLVLVLFLAMYLLVVDVIWSQLLELVGVLRSR